MPGTIYEVGDKSGVYCIEGAGRARVYYVAAPEFTLIDAGMPGQTDHILSALAQIGVQPLQVKRILVTHHHLDDVGSLYGLRKHTGAQVIAHPSDADYISGRRPRRAPSPGHVVSALVGLWGARRLQHVDPDRAAKDGDRIGSFTVIHTPGHTPGHLCFLRGDYLFSGDLLIASSGRFRETPHVFTADVQTSRASIRRVATLDFQAILSAHNPPYVFGAAAKVRELANRMGMFAEED